LGVVLEVVVPERRAVGLGGMVAVVCLVVVVVVVVRKGVKIRMDREAVGGEPWCLP
jgi:hypothetical protein